MSHHIKTASKAHLQDALQKILEAQGEGLIVRAPRSPYFHGRSEDAIKFKRYAREEEGVVTDSSLGQYSVLLYVLV